MTDSLILRLAIALGLGLLVGLQRELTERTIAGVRTFALVTILGSVTALLSETFGGWLLGTGLLAVAAMVVVGNLTKLKAGDRDPGITTEIAVLMMFGLGALVVLGPLELGIVLGGTVTVLLQAKGPLRRLAGRLGDEDVTTIMRFVLITLVILPVLPNRSYGPFDVLNPRQIWLMVVLIVGISLAGYLAYKLVGERVGAVLAGVLGGTISSTATTVSYARQSRSGARAVDVSAIVVLIASSMVFLRVLVEIAVVAPGAFPQAAPPLSILLASFMALSGVAWSRARTASTEPADHGNPTELKSALIFGALYALILLAVAGGREWFGDQGLYAIGVLSGLTDMDAITLSTAQLTRAGRIGPDTLWRVTTVAALSNLAFKLGIVGTLGGSRIFRRLLPFFGAGAAVASALLLLWPPEGPP